MTGIHHTQLLDQDRNFVDTDVDDRHSKVPPRITIEQSIEAYDLAVQSNAIFSFEDLLRSGTWHKYEKRASSLARKHSSCDPYISYLSTDHINGWTSANSRQSYRSALIRMAAKEVLEMIPIYWRQMITDEKNADNRKRLLRSLERHFGKDVFDQIGNVKERFPVGQGPQLASAINFLLEVRPDPHHKALRNRPTKEASCKESRKSRSLASKKTALYALHRHQRRKAQTFPNYDWRSHFWTRAVLPDDHLDDHRRACIATLMLTGCRPSELSEDLGITVRKMTVGDHPSLMFEIRGAKVSAEIGYHLGKGQDHREIEMMCRTDEALWLFDQVSRRAEGCVALQLPAATHKQTGEMLMPSERHRRVSVSLEKRVARLGKIAFPKLRHHLTPYVFRHAFTSDFKAGGHEFDAADLAAALGHQSVRTQEHYGSANTARGLIGSRALQVTNVRSSTPVRQPERQGYPSTEHPDPTNFGFPL